MFLQAIVIGDDAYELEKASRSFSNKHIFPGGCLPSLGLITELRRRQRDPGRPPVEDISDHYALTLAIWRERFNDAWPSLRPRGYDERFGRLVELLPRDLGGRLSRAADPRPADRAGEARLARARTTNGDRPLATPAAASLSS